VQDLERGARVLECAVDRLRGGAQVLGERREPEVRHFVAQEPAREADGVDTRV